MQTLIDNRRYRKSSKEEEANDDRDARRLNEGLLELWDRDEALDCESLRHRRICDLVGEPVG
jgi:hypothetical protein